MKTNLIKSFKKVSFCFLVVPFCIVLYSCSNENMNETEVKDNAVIEDVLIKTSPSIDESVRVQFNEFISKNKLTRSIKDEQWDFENMVEFSSPSNSIYCYMVFDKNDPNKILGGCSTAKDVIITFFTFVKNGDLYTLIDSSNEPVADVRLDLKKEQIHLVKLYNSQTRASGSEWCGIGMGVAGGVGAAFAPMTLGASIGFAVCWGVVSALMCR